MATLSRSATFVTSDPPAEAVERCRAWLAQRASAEVVIQEPEHLEVASGSQIKLRLIGGAFVAPSSLPVRTVVDARPTATGSELTVTATDSVGFGLKTGMKKKYERWLEEIVSGLRAAGV
jgi:hypothetical protein